MWPDWPLGPKTRRGDEEVDPAGPLELLPSNLLEELPVVLADATYEAEVAVAVLLIPF